MLLFAAVITACTVAPDTRLEDSQRVVRALGQQLKQTLQQTIEKEGPVVALDVCRVTAPAIAAELSQRNNLQVGRTALRVRNVNNAPSEWQAGVLRDFQQRLKRKRPFLRVLALMSLPTYFFQISS